MDRRWPRVYRRSNVGLVFELTSVIRYLEHHVSATKPIRPQEWFVNIGAGNGWVPPGNKPLSQPMLTKFYNAIWHHLNTLRPAENGNYFADIFEYMFLYSTGEYENPYYYIPS